MEKYSLVDDALFSCTDTTGRRFSASLPEILARLCKAEISSFDALQLHQKQAWHCFLVQLGAIALTRSNETFNPSDAEFPSDANTWRRMLLSLTDGETAPWCIVVDNPAKPAFMQPPVPEGSLEDANYKLDIETPDDLDMLITAKNHDIKARRLKNAELEHWIYALVTLQTQQGFLGVGNYGIARMNGGFGNRPQVGRTPHLDWCSRFTHDLQVLLRSREELVSEFQYDPEGITMLWIEPWDGAKDSSIHYQQCDPYFIEICRRIRFKTDGNQVIQCWRSNTKATRLELPDELLGVTGDPWTPVEKSKNKAFSLGGSGWNYETVRNVLFSNDYKNPAALDVESTDIKSFFVATALVRGQGETEGYHHRVIPLPRKVMSLMAEPDRKQQLAARSEDYARFAADVQRRVLYPAVRALLTAGTGNENAKIESNKIQKVTNRFKDSVDQVFFQQLWDDVTLPEEQAYKNWQETLYTIAGKLKEQAIKSYPVPSIRRYKAVSRADAVFEGSARKVLDRLFPENFIHMEETQHEPAGK